MHLSGPEAVGRVRPCSSKPSASRLGAFHQTPTTADPTRSPDCGSALKDQGEQLAQWRMRDPWQTQRHNNTERCGMWYLLDMSSYCSFCFKVKSLNPLNVLFFLLALQTGQNQQIIYKGNLAQSMQYNYITGIITNILELPGLHIPAATEEVSSFRPDFVLHKK